MRYIRTEGDRRARRSYRGRARRGSIWVCPACRAPMTSAKGLAWHLVAWGPEMGKPLCPANLPGWRPEPGRQEKLM